LTLLIGRNLNVKEAHTNKERMRDNKPHIKRVALSDIRCRTNTEPLMFRNLKFIDGRSVLLEIEPYRALIDDGGIIRFFTVDIPIFRISAALLHPYYTVTPSHVNTERAELVASAVGGLTDFLTGFGVSQDRRKLLKISGRLLAVDMAKSFLFDPLVTHTIRSFAKDLIEAKTEERQEIDFGYHDIENDTLMLPGAILRAGSN
jgi:hypothetical protein